MIKICQIVEELDWFNDEGNFIVRRLPNGSIGIAGFWFEKDWGDEIESTYEAIQEAIFDLEDIFGVELDDSQAAENIVRKEFKLADSSTLGEETGWICVIL